MQKLTSSIRALRIRRTSGKKTKHSKDTTAGRGSTSTATQPSLEGLPVELQGQIMSKAPTLQSLSALVHASPVLYRVYIEDRLRILRSVLGNTLEGMLVDALGAHQSGTDLFRKTRETPLLSAFVKEHEAKYTKAEDHCISQLTFEDVTHLFHFHLLVIEPIAEWYATRALALLPASPEDGEAGEAAQQKPLSDTERRRIQRAMYRLQLFCNMFESRGGVTGPLDWSEANVDRLCTLSMFPPWEIEQILCIHELMKDNLNHNDAFMRVARDLNMEDSGHANVKIRPRNTVLRPGLELLHGIVKTREHEQLIHRIRTTVLSSLAHRQGSYLTSHWIDDAVTGDIQEKRRERSYSQHDLAQDFRHKVTFGGDKLESPPLAWVIYWRGEYSNLTGEYVEPELRRWGFAMWDADRLGSRPMARIDFWSHLICGRGEDEDPRGDYYDDSVRVERPEDWLYT